MQAANDALATTKNVYQDATQIVNVTNAATGYYSNCLLYTSRCV